MLIKRNKQSKFLIFILTVVFLLSNLSMVLASQSNNDVGIIDEVRSLIKENYLYDFDENILKENDIETLVKKLNEPYTIYFSPENYKEFNNSVEQQFGGIGVQFELIHGYLTIVSVLPNTPAEKAGLKKGDRITVVDGKNIINLPSENTIELIRGEPGSTTSLTVLRKGEKSELYFNVVRDVIHLDVITTSILESNIGYIGISSFSQSAGNDFKKAINDLKSKGMKGLILDLRNNPGGYLNSGLNIAAAFAGEGEIILEVYNKNGQENVYRALTPALNIPTIVLINENTASASEIVAGAIQDLSKGQLLGTKTYGKGLVQTVYPLSNGGALKITTAKYLTPKKQEINGKGLTPDYVVEDVNSQLPKAIEILKQDLGVKDTAVEAAKKKINMRLGSNYMLINGKKVALGGIIELKNNRIVLPAKSLVTELGGRMGWNPKTKAVTVSKEKSNLVAALNKKQGLLNGKNISLNAALTIKADKAYLSLADLAKVLKLEINFDNKTKNITINETK